MLENGFSPRDVATVYGVRVSNTSTRPPVCVSVTKLFETGSMGITSTAGVPQHRRNRLEFALDHQNRQLCHWRPVLFTNESCFLASTCDRRARLWRKSGERCADCNVLAKGDGSVMVWAGIFLDGSTDLHVIDRSALIALRYQDEVMHPIVRPFARIMPDHTPPEPSWSTWIRKGSMLWGCQLDPRI